MRRKMNFVAVVVKVVHECDDFGVDVLRFHTCLTDILGFLEKLEWWFEQDIDDEGEEGEECEGGIEGNPQHGLKDKGVIDIGCSRHITGNISYLSDFKEINRGYVAFDGNPKGDTECIVLSSDFKLPNENHVLLRVPKENNMYNVDLHNIVPSGDLTCLAEAVNTACYVQNKSMSYQPVVTENQPNSSAGIQENLNASTVRKEATSVQQYVLLPLWSSGSKDPQNTDAAASEVKEPESAVHVSPSSCDKPKKHDDKSKIMAKGKSLVELSTGVRDLRNEFEEFSDNSTNGVNAASTPVTAVGINSTDSTNTFSAVGPSNNVVSLNFDLGGKYSFVDPSQYFDDLDMPTLEDITYSNNEEDVGAKADFSNLETNITVSPIPTTRVYKDHPITQIIGDLSSAPRIRSMIRMVKKQGGMTQINDDDFHTCMFACFLSQEEPKRVHQTLKDPSWIEAMQEDLFQFKMQKEEGIDYEEVFAPVARIEAIRLFLAYASFMGFMKQDGIFISQDKYVAEILRKFGLIERKLASTPIDTKKPLLKDPDGEDVDVHTYRSMIGSLMYLTSSRPYIMFAVCACACFQVTPKALHLHAVKRIFRYLKGKPNVGLWYPKDLSFNLETYSDSNYAGASLDRKSTTGGR
nr:hypothetical protein [Tanacetum cinerariifolium]